MSAVRLTVILMILIVAAGLRACSSVQPAASRLTAPETKSGANVSAGTEAKIDFERQIRPIFQARCQPCHFQGGKVYDRLPFDRPETIKTLGTKLFTRIKDEDERKIIREFLSQS
jgi:hypothetical protein